MNVMDAPLLPSLYCFHSQPLFGSGLHNHCRTNRENGGRNGAMMKTNFRFQNFPQPEDRSGIFHSLFGRMILSVRILVLYPFLILLNRV